jgi:hypothetical protein
MGECGCLTSRRRKIGDAQQGLSTGVELCDGLCLSLAYSEQIQWTGNVAFGAAADNFAQ